MSRNPTDRIYETVYILKSATSESDATAIHGKIDSVIQKFKGTVKERDDWGMRDLAYPINKEKSGKYSVVVYTGNSGVVEEIERHFKISPDVIRFLTVRMEGDYDYSKARKAVQLHEEEFKRSRELKKKAAQHALM
jgi:small subunit ribosomal protein S6